MPAVAEREKEKYILFDSQKSPNCHFEGLHTLEEFQDPQGWGGMENLSF